MSGLSIFTTDADSNEKLKEELTSDKLYLKPDIIAGFKSLIDI